MNDEFEIVEFADGEEEVAELEDLDVDTVGLVPQGANRRKFIVRKGGVEVDIQELAKAIAEDPKFWETVVKAVEEEQAEEEKQDKSKMAAKMAVRILSAHKEKYPEAVQQALKAIADYAEKAGKDEGEGYEEESKAKPEPEEEETEEKARKKPEDYEYEEPAQKGAAIPAEFAERLGAAEKRAQEAEAKIVGLMQRLEEKERESRRKELLQKAEMYAVLPEVEPESFAEVLLKLEETDPELYAAVTKVIDTSANAVRHLYGELGTDAAPTETSPYLQQVEALTKKKMQENPELTYAEAYAEAYVEVGDENPNLAWAFRMAETR